MKFTDELARRAVIILMLLTLANLWASWKTADTVHRLENTINAQAQAAVITASTAKQTAEAATQTAAAVQSTANSAKTAASSINQAAHTLCSAAQVDCKDGAKPPLLPTVSKP